MKEILFNYLTKNTSLNREEKETILGFFKEISLDKNDYWVKQNDVCENVAFLCEGILRVFHEFDGDEVTLQFVLPQTFAIPISSLANNSPSLLNYQSLTDCKLLVISKEMNHNIMFKYAKAFNLNESYFLKSYTEMESRLLALLHLDAEQRFQKLFSEHPEIFNLVPLKHIATSLGMTAETLSRLRKKHVTIS